MAVLGSKLHLDNVPGTAASSWCHLVLMPQPKLFFYTYYPHQGIVCLYSLNVNGSRSGCAGANGVPTADDREYYNDLPGKMPPEHAPAPRHPPPPPLAPLAPLSS